MSSLQEALLNAGVAEIVQNNLVAARRAEEVARKEKSAKMSPHQRWWQNFRMTVTAFEVRVFIKVQCDKWTEGLDFIAAHNLNRVTTRCKTREEAIEQIREKIMAWEAESVLAGGVEPPAGSLLYWRVYVDE